MTAVAPERPTIDQLGLRPMISAPTARGPHSAEAETQPDSIDGHVDGDLLQARTFAARHFDIPTALARLASSELAFGNRVSAADAARAVLKANSFDAPSHFVAAQVLASLGETDEAETALEIMLDAPDEDENSKRAAAYLAAQIAAHQGDTDKALRLLAGPTGPAGAALKGSLLAQKGRYGEAIRELRAALKDVPDSPAALSNLGFAYAAAGSPRKALRSAIAAAALDPADRTAGINLAAIHIAQEQPDEALSAIDRLTAHHPDDPHLAFAAAEAHHIAGDTQAAIRRLSRAAQSASASNSTALAEEIRLRSLLLETPAMPRTAMVEAASAALRRCEYRSVIIARILASAAQTPADLPALEKAHRSLAQHYDRAELLPLKTQTAFLQFDFHQSQTAAVEWARNEPFNANAHILAVYILALHQGDYTQAARIGTAGINRGVNDPTLNNNTAFALAMGGHLDAAARMLPDPAECPAANATAGLIETVRGNPELGKAKYDACAQQARSRNDTDFADLVGIHQLLAEAVADTLDRRRIDAYNDRADTDPRFAIVRNAIHRELNTHLSDADA